MSELQDENKKEKEEKKAKSSEGKKTIVCLAKVGRKEGKQSLVVKAKCVREDLFSTNTLNLLLPSIFLDSLQVSWNNYVQEFGYKSAVFHAEFDIARVEIEPFHSWSCTFLPSQIELSPNGAFALHQSIIGKGSFTTIFSSFCARMKVFASHKAIVQIAKCCSYVVIRFSPLVMSFELQLFACFKHIFRDIFMPLDAVFHEFCSALRVMQVIHLRVYTCDCFLTFVKCYHIRVKSSNTYSYTYCCCQLHVLSHTNASLIIPYPLKHALSSLVVDLHPMAHDARELPSCVQFHEFGSQLDSTLCLFFCHIFDARIGRRKMYYTTMP